MATSDPTKQMAEMLAEYAVFQGTRNGIDEARLVRKVTAFLQRRFPGTLADWREKLKEWEVENE